MTHSNWEQISPLVDCGGTMRLAFLNAETITVLAWLEADAELRAH
jgi:hypothetical protein